MQGLYFGLNILKLFKTIILKFLSWMYTSEFINLTAGPEVFLDSYVGKINFKTFNY